MTDPVSSCPAGLLMFGFTGTTVNDHARRLIKLGAGGVILFSRNFQDPLQVAHLCRDLKEAASPRKLLIAVDQEGGRVSRLGPPFTLVPSARTIGQTGDPGLAQAVGYILGRELRAVNIDLDFAPVVDVDTNPKNPVIGDRSFGDSPKLTIDMAEGFIGGIQKEGVASCAKHFPGHGDTLVDSHFDLPLLPHSLERLQEVELPPFQRGIQSGVACVMVAHLITPALDLKPEATSSKRETEEQICAGSELRNDGEVSCKNGNASSDPARSFPASLSSSAVQYLRKAMDFRGVVVSDCLEMGAITKHWGVPEAAVTAVAAGVDVVLVCHTEDIQVKTIEALTGAIKTGKIFPSRLKEALGNVEELKRKYCALSRDCEVDESRIMQIVGCREHHNLVEEMNQAAAAKVMF